FGRKYNILKAIDFGTAVPEGDDPVGVSPVYILPEYAKHAMEKPSGSFKADCSFEVWSLGVVFMQCLTNEHLTLFRKFDERNKMDYMKFLTDEKKCNELFLSQLDEWLDSASMTIKNLLRDMLNFNPKQRPTIGAIINSGRYDFFHIASK